MNHQQAQSFERLHATATAATGTIHVQAEDVRNVLDAAADYGRLLEAATRELREAKTQLLERAVVEPVPHPPAGAAAAPVTVTTIEVPGIVATGKPATISTGPEAGS